MPLRAKVSKLKDVPPVAEPLPDLSPLSTSPAPPSELPSPPPTPEAPTGTLRGRLKRRERPKKAEKGTPLADTDEVEVSVPSRPVLVEFRSVSMKYGTHVALENISLRLYKGEFLSLVGPSGAGKSTLIKCLTLQERPQEGRIIVAGRDITMLKKRELPYYRRKVGFIFQDYKLLATKTVYENIAFALEVCGIPNREMRERVQIMLETVGMYTKKDSFPHELSGGEQQRVAIARALVHDPKILIADEPTGNLDPVNTWEIIELLYKINRSGTMVILATHDREIVDALKKRVITLRAGQLVADQEKGTYLV